MAGSRPSVWAQRGDVRESHPGRAGVNDLEGQFQRVEVISDFIHHVMPACASSAARRRSGEHFRSRDFSVFEAARHCETSFTCLLLCLYLLALT